MKNWGLSWAEKRSLIIAGIKYVCVYMYIYIHMHTCIYTYIERERLNIYNIHMYAYTVSPAFGYICVRI